MYATFRQLSIGKNDKIFVSWYYLLLSFTIPCHLVLLGVCNWHMHLHFFIAVWLAQHPQPLIRGQPDSLDFNHYIIQVSTWRWPGVLQPTSECLVGFEPESCPFYYNDLFHRVRIVVPYSLPNNFLSAGRVSALQLKIYNNCFAVLSSFCQLLCKLRSANH